LRTRPWPCYFFFVSLFNGYERFFFFGGEPVFGGVVLQLGDPEFTMPFRLFPPLHPLRLFRPPAFVGWKREVPRKTCVMGVQVLGPFLFVCFSRCLFPSHPTHITIPLDSPLCLCWTPHIARGFSSPGPLFVSSPCFLRFFSDPLFVF